MSELETPPTEAEIASIASVDPTKIVRRLAFQRDRLQTIVDKLQLVRREAVRFINSGKVVDPDDTERLAIAIRCVQAAEAAMARTLIGSAEDVHQ